MISYDQGRWSAPCFVTTTTGQAGVVLGVEKVRAVLCHAALRCIVLRFACFVGWLHAPSLGASVAHTHTLSLSSFSLPLSFLLSSFSSFLPHSQHPKLTHPCHVSTGSMLQCSNI